MIFEEKYLSSYIYLNFIAWLPLLRKILSNICIAITCEPDCDAINFNYPYQSDCSISSEQTEIAR